jgi:epoxyqueuosine reductase
MTQGNLNRSEFRFVPMSTDEGKIRFFGTLMPALLLLKASPGGFLRLQIAAHSVPRQAIGAHIASEADDAARAEDTFVFVHRWESPEFDPFAFARAKAFLARLTRLVQRAGYQAEPLDPLSPRVNLPVLAARAGLGDLSPFGLLVHPVFGPRLVITALRTSYVMALVPRWGGSGCTDCQTCVELCPQAPQASGVINLGLCQRCAECLIACPTGNGQLNPEEA